MNAPSRRLVSTTLAITLLILIATSGVSGHAKLVRAEPAPGTTVTAAPQAIRAWFSDELDVRRSAISVWDDHGRRADDGKGRVDLNDLDRKSMVAKLKPVTPGRYTVKWRAVSADDLNVAEGTFQFTVAPP